MIDGGIGSFFGKRVLLLQGPVGPFFARLAHDLRSAGAEVHKVNFNAGDWLFYRQACMNYRGTLDEWPQWLEARLRELRIDTVLLFGDCRPVHQAAHAVASRLGLEIGVFEEGYVRPDYLTLERFGVNGYSRLPRTPEAYAEDAPAPATLQGVGNAYWHMVGWGFLYFTVGALGTPAFPRYEHHRPLSIFEAFYWIRSAWRKHWYRWRERGVQDRLTGPLSQQFYLVPLQVFNDAQLRVHALLDGVESFIQATLDSFVRNAPAGTLLVFKHHPMDRGYKDYGPLIARAAAAAGVADRVLYIHDQHLPSLLDSARGVVVVNSTVGLSALHHGAPTKVCGRALYDLPGLTYQGGLDDFWREAPEHRPEPTFYRRFRAHLIARTQLNGSFYKRLPGGSATGLEWARSARTSPRPGAPEPGFVEDEQLGVRS